MSSPIKETLERRRLLAATVGAVWTITGSDAGESIIVDADGSTLRTIVNGQVTATHPLAGLDLIEIISNGGNDSIKIDLHEAYPGLGIWVNAGPGRDAIFGGPGDECLIGGSGRDFVDGGRGNDIVRGGTDRDDVSGGDGDDYVQGNAGNDTLSGGWGDDRITGGTGFDQIRGGEGDDRIAGGKDSDTIKGGGGNDLLHAGGGVANAVYREVGADEIVTGPLDLLMTDDDADQPLQRLQTQDELRDWLIERAVAQWKGTFGQEANTYWAWDGGGVFLANSSGGLDALLNTDGNVPPRTPGTADASDTNTQESGVDEADTVETDGQYLYLLHNDELIIADADPAADLHIVSRTKIDGSPSGIYLDGDRVTVLSQSGGYVVYYGIGGVPVRAVDVTTNDIIAPPQVDEPKVKVTVLDVSDRAHPTTVSTTSFDGSLSNSRVIDGRLYVVLQNYLNAPVPKTITRDGKEFYESEDAYRARLRGGGVDDIIPGYTADAPGAADGKILQAPDVYVRAGDRLDTTSVALINLRDAEPAPISTASVIGADGQVYASRDHLYLAGYGWDGTSQHTELLKFNLGIDQVSLAASGRVSGSINNQFSMDEEGVFFRVATTDVVGNEISNAVTVFTQVGDELTVLGQSEKLGIDERIFSARFIGDRAYVVTFRQVDPLFVIDLSDPAAPKLAGELTIPGFSNYLQPIGNGDFLLGLGQAATENGVAGNAQLSLFNVSDPGHPTRVDQFEFDSSYSIASYDPHAFSYFPEQGVLAVPGDGSAIQVLRVDTAKGFTKLGSIDHEGGYVTRTVRIGGDVFSIGNDAIKVRALDNLTDDIAVLPLPQIDVTLPPPVPVME